MTASSTRSLRAFFNASLSLLGAIPSSAAASSMMAWLSSPGEDCDAAMAAPLPPAARIAAAPMTSLCLRFSFTLCPFQFD